MTPMEPLPETVEALNELEPLTDERELLADLVRLARRAQAIVPDLVGVSIATLDEGITFTLVATAEEIAVLDAVQYAAGGPCVEGAHAADPLELSADELLDEERWRLFAEATAAHTVRSTLTLPVLGAAGRVVGTVNLYGASRRAFGGHQQQLAEVFGAWAPGAVANADLSFTTRREARAAPERIRENTVIEVATGILAVELGLDVRAAGARLRDAAARAGVEAVRLAHEIVRARDRRAPPAE
jgi:GAF domain-containing protein